MKRYTAQYSAISYLYCAVLLLFSACATYNFSQPLPVNKPNLYQFPADWQGTWKRTDNTHLLIIQRQYAALIIIDHDIVVKGVWPKLDSNKNFVYPPTGYTGMYEVHFDSLKQPVDTAALYYLHGNRIHECSAYGMLEKGYPYKLQEDTLRVNKTDTFWLDLGKNTFLRKLDNNIYALNIRNRIAEIENNWWQIILLKQIAPNKISYWDGTSALTKDTSMFYSKYSNYYFNSQWTAAEMIQLMKKNAFEECEQLTRAGK